MKILVTGYRGYIGSHVYNKLIDIGYQVKGVDLKDGEDIVHCLPEEDFDTVFHLAALPRVEYSMKNPSYTLRQNVLTTSVLLEWAKKHNVKRVIFSSSSAVNGDGEGPNSPYGLHKLMSEMECRLYSKLYNLDTVSLRYFNVYSEDQAVDGPYSTAIANFMECVRKGENPYITGDGEQRRDMIHVSDVVAANIFCMEYDGSFDGQYFDTATGGNISLNEIREIVNKFFPDVEFSYILERPGDVKETKADIIPLKEIGWHAMIDIKQGISSCFQKLKEKL